MTSVTKLWPILTAMHRYDKSLSTRNIGLGQIIEAPILAYLIETKNGRILYDVGCDYNKIKDPALRNRYYNPEVFEFGAPEMLPEQRLPNQLARIGIAASDIDVIFLSHLHFDHAGGLCDLCGAEVHIQADELAAANGGHDLAYFDNEVVTKENWVVKEGEYNLSLGVSAISSPGHTAGHMSLWVEMPKGPPILLAGDAADLMENIDDEIAPGNCWQNRTDLAIDSIRKIKKLARNEGADLWPNHDIVFWNSLKQFPEFHT